MLFRRQELDGIATGESTVVHRRWQRPMVREGGTQITRAGVVIFESVEAVGSQDDGTEFRIACRLIGPDPRIALRERDDLTEDELTALATRLERMDARSDAPWTRRVLELIELEPAVRAADLAAGLGSEKQPFKLRVRRLKALGLTESLEVGYRLSPRGLAVLTWMRR